MTKPKSSCLKTDRCAGTHKHSKDGMWLPLSRQFEAVIYVLPPKQKENKKWLNTMTALC